MRIEKIKDIIAQQYDKYKQCVIDMIKDNESGLYIKIYINDLLRGNDITIEQAEELHALMIDAIGGNGFDTIAVR